VLMPAATNAANVRTHFFIAILPRRTFGAVLKRYCPACEPETIAVLPQPH